MPITMATLQLYLGERFDENGDYVCSTHREAHYYDLQGYTKVGEVPDSTLGDSGTLVVFDRAPKQRAAEEKAAKAAREQAERRENIRKANEAAEARAEQARQPKVEKTPPPYEGGFRKKYARKKRGK